MARRRRGVLSKTLLILFITFGMVYLIIWVSNHQQETPHLHKDTEEILRKHHYAFTRMASQDELLHETQGEFKHSNEEAEYRQLTSRNISNKDDFMHLIEHNIKRRRASMHTSQLRSTMPVIPLVYVITPTYWRLEQKAELIRIANALRYVPRLRWLVIEDSVRKTERISRFLQNCKVNYTHLFTPTPTGTDIMRLYKVSKFGHKGVLQRNEGLDWVIQNAEFPSVLYFADDDNTYDPRIFEEVRYTQRVSVFPVGLVGGSLYEAPVVKNGKIVDWITSFPVRTFPVDMAGFAVNTEFYIKAGKPKFNIVTQRGTIENGFLEDLRISKKDLEPKADNCTKVLVWHTKTQRSSILEKTEFEKSRRKYLQSLLEV